MKHITTIIFSLFVGLISAQQSEYFYGLTLFDSEYSSNKIRNAQVRITDKEGEKIYISDNQGKVFFKSFSNKLKLNITHVGYFELDTAIQHNAIPFDTTFFTFSLNVKGYVAAETVIKNPFEPVQLFGSSRLSVEDFELLQDDKLVLLTYERKLNKGTEILLVDQNEKILSSNDGGGNARELVRDFRGNIHLVTESSVFHLEPREKNLDIFRMEKDYFLKYVAPIIDTVDSKMYFSNYQEIYPSVDFFSFDKLDSVYKKITKVEDEVMMEMYLSEYKWVDVRTKLWAREMEQDLGIDKEIIIGASIFTNSIFYKEIYAPLFVKNDTIYVFDFYKELMFSYDMEGEPIDSIAITHHLQPKKTGWKNQLLQDSETGEIFAVFERVGNTTLRHIDLETGELGEGIQLHYRYVDKLALQNNAAFYIYRPYESAQKKFLYKEKLPLKYNSSDTVSGDDLTKKN